MKQLLIQNEQGFRLQSEPNATQLATTPQQWESNAKHWNPLYTSCSSIATDVLLNQVVAVGESTPVYPQPIAPQTGTSTQPPAQPEMLTTAAFVMPGSLLVSFQDGRTAKFDPEQLVSKKDLLGLSFASARVTDDGSAIEIDQTNGGVYHIDAIALRGLIDPAIRKQIASEKKHAYAELGAHIRQVRTTHGAGILTVAHAAGVSPGKLEAIESGRLRPKSQELTAIANAIGVPVQSLLPVKE